MTERTIVVTLEPATAHRLDRLAESFPSAHEGSIVGTAVDLLHDAILAASARGTMPRSGMVCAADIVEALLEAGAVPGAEA